MSVPADIKSQLMSNEKVLKVAVVVEGEIYVTDKRILFKAITLGKKEIREIVYPQITSIEYKTRREVGWLLVGILIIAFILAASLLQINLPLYLYILLAIPLIIILSVGSTRIPSYYLHIADGEPIKLSAKGLENLIDIIRKYVKTQESQGSIE